MRRVRPDLDREPHTFLVDAADFETQTGTVYFGFATRTPPVVGTAIGIHRMGAAHTPPPPSTPTASSAVWAAG